MTTYRAWDREEKLGPPPYKHDDPKLVAWEKAHGHDCRLKCFEEFGCTVAEIEVTDDMVDRAFDLLEETVPVWSEVRTALEAALRREVTL